MTQTPHTKHYRGNRCSSSEIFQATVTATRSCLPSNSVYADWAARALPLRCICGLERCELCHVSNIPRFFSHPHSSSPFDNSSPVNAAREALSSILGDAGATHDVILSASATDALRTIAYRLPWHPGCLMVCHTHAHSSLLGIRGPATAAGASFCALNSLELDSLLLNSPPITGPLYREGRDGYDQSQLCEKNSFALLAYPGECNLTGTIYPVAEWAEAAHCRFWTRDIMPEPQSIVDVGASQTATVTLVDAAALAANSPLSSKMLRYVDLLVCSVYKMTGTPTGIGALLVRRGSVASKLLHSTAYDAYFAGGRSISSISVRSRSSFVPSKSVVDTLELGTPNLDALVQLPSLARLIRTNLGGMQNVFEHAGSVAQLFRYALLDAFPPSAVHLHCDTSARNGLLAGDVQQAPVVSFSLFREDKSPIGHREVEALLKLNQVDVRSGCMCNPGACAEALGLDDDMGQGQFLVVARCREEVDVVDGRHTGVVRASFGWANTNQDAMRIVEVLRTSFGPVIIPRGVSEGYREVVKGSSARVSALYIYPLKGAQGQALSTVFAARDLDGTTTGGIVGDRFLALRDMDAGELLSRRSCRELDNIRVSVTGTGFDAGKDAIGTEPSDGAMIRFCFVPSHDNNTDTEDLCFKIPVNQPYSCSESSYFPFSVNEKVLSRCSQWLETLLGGLRVRIVSSNSASGNMSNRGDSVHVVNLSSCAVVARCLGEDWDAYRVAYCSRANIVVDCASPWSEDFWKRVGNIGELQPCVRCSTMNNELGQPLRTIVELRRSLPGHRKLVCFGVVGRIMGDRWTGKVIDCIKIHDALDVESEDRDNCS